MKKILTAITVAILVACASNSLAATPDGGVFLRNSHIDPGISDIQLDGVSISEFVSVQVLAAAWDGTPGGLLPSLSPSFSPLVNFGTSVSTFSGNTDPGFEGTFDGGVGVAPVGAGGRAQFQIIAWFATTPQTFETATLKGQSVVWGQVTGVAPTAGPPPTTGLPVDLAIPVGNIALVPEPSTVALAVLGGLGLLFRRRK